MSLLKRFELWLLLLLIGGGLSYVFFIQQPGGRGGRDPLNLASETVSAPPQAPSRFTLKRTMITRDGSHFLAEIELLCRNDTAEELTLEPPTTRLLAAGAREVPAFFLPFHPAPRIPTSGEAVVTLRYWLDREQINGPMSLEIGRDTVAIKSGPFDAEAFRDKERRCFTGIDWTFEA